MLMRSAVERYVHQHRCLSRDHPDAPLTHTLLDGHAGGKLVVAAHLEAGFLLAYASDVCALRPLYVNELRPQGDDGVFRFFMDVDLEVETPERDLADAWRPIMRAVASALALFYPQWTPEERLKRGAAIVLRAEDKVTPEWRPTGAAPDVPARSVTKVAMHIILPDLLVNSERARYIRQLVVDTLDAGDAALGLEDAGKPVVTWDKVIDENVYVSTGLRMFMSHKTGRCPGCNNQRPSTCRTCAGRGKVDLGRPYRFHAACRGDAQASDDAARVEELASAGTTRLVFLTSIRPAAVAFASAALPTRPTEITFGVPARLPTRLHVVDDAPAAQLSGEEEAARALAAVEPTPGWVLFPGAPAPRAALHLGLSEDRAGIARLRRSFTTTVNPPDARISMLQGVIRRLRSEYELLRVVCLMINGRGDILARVAGPGETFCQNIMGSHKHSSIYFKVTHAGVRQQCFCHCNTSEGRLHGPCSRYASPAVPLDRSALITLFPNSAVYNGDSQSSLRAGSVPASPGGTPLARTWSTFDTPGDDALTTMQVPASVLARLDGDGKGGVEEALQNPRVKRARRD